MIGVGLYGVFDRRGLPLMAKSRPRVTHFGTSAQGQEADIAVLAIDPHFQGYGNPWFSVQAVACTEIISFRYSSPAIRRESQAGMSGYG